MTTAVIEMRNVHRSYTVKEGKWKKTKREVEAVKDISFEVKKGEIFGLLGPNGAGKTTTIKMMTTMLIPSSGEIRILGYNPVNEHKKLRSEINFILGGERNLYWRLTAYDNLAYFADLYKIPRSEQTTRIPELLKLVDLEEAAHRKVETFSKGMKQRLQIARGLLNNPKILFLDEPSIGLDPVSARNLRNLLKQLNEQGTTIVLTTHYMQEADELCDRIAFINNGHIIAIDTPENLKAETKGLSIVECKITESEKEVCEMIFATQSFVQYVILQHDNEITARIHTYEPQQVAAWLFGHSGLNIADVSISSTTLEDAYIQLIGGK